MIKLHEVDIEFSLTITEHSHVVSVVCQEMLLSEWMIIDIVFDGISTESEMHQVIKERLRLSEWYQRSYDAMSDAMSAINETFNHPKIGVVLRFADEGLFQWKDRLVLPLLDVLRDRRSVINKEFEGTLCRDRLAIVWHSPQSMFPVLSQHAAYSVKAF